LPTPPVPVTPPLPLPPPVPHHVAAHHIPRLVHHIITPKVVQPPQPLPAAPPPPAPPPAAAAPPSQDELAQFAAAMHRAIQEALIFPDSAQMAHESGTVRIRFDYLDGAVSNITVIASCGYPELDDAAVETARAAHYPPPPADFAGHTTSVDVDVIFPAAAPSVDSD
jgi:protein TonB